MKHQDSSEDKVFLEIPSPSVSKILAVIVGLLFLFAGLAFTFGAAGYLIYQIFIASPRDWPNLIGSVFGLVLGFVGVVGGWCFITVRIDG